METTDERAEGLSPKRVRRRKKEVYGLHLDDLSAGQRLAIVDAMCAAYSEVEQEDIAYSDERERDDLRMRVDGQPSASAPAAVLPLSHWATVQEAPDGIEHDSTEERLLMYQRQLEFWAAKGIYRGPTELTSVNPESREPDAKP